MKTRTKKPAKSPYSATLKKLVRFTRSQSTRTKVLALIGILSTAVLISAAMARAHQEALFVHAVATPAESSVAAAPRLETPAALPEPVVTEQPKKLAAVTITGCLERDAETFRLKDTAGENAPRARSWKSGFLKKGSASIEVIDAANRVKLPTHVGQRVSVTGTLVDREMQVRSLQRVATSCSLKS